MINYDFLISVNLLITPIFTYFTARDQNTLDLRTVFYMSSNKNVFISRFLTLVTVGSIRLLEIKVCLIVPPSFKNSSIILSQNALFSFYRTTSVIELPELFLK